MKILINALLVLGIAYLSFLLYNSIYEPIEFKTEMEKRKDKVADKLNDIRNCEEIYRSITGTFASNFDTLIYVLEHDSIPEEQVFGDPDDPENEDKFIYKTVYYSALDSINAMGINLKDLPYVPYTENKAEFTMQADTITYQSTLVSVCEVGTRWDVFMGKYGDPKFQMYDNMYDPKKAFKFGDMNSPSLAGNWE